MIAFLSLQDGYSEVKHIEFAQADDGFRKGSTHLPRASPAVVFQRA
jgi:hypothetical protein